jgi:hypothetical protein
VVGLTQLHTGGRSKKNTSSYVVSSYIPTFKALAYAREESLELPTQLDQRFLIVAVPKTTGRTDLDLAEEVSAIEQSLTRSSAFKAKVLNNPSKDKLLEELKVSRVVHFACHGVSVAEDPSSSGLLLRNGPNGNKHNWLIYPPVLSRELFPRHNGQGYPLQALFKFPHIIGTF